MRFNFVVFGDSKLECTQKLNTAVGLFWHSGTPMMIRKVTHYNNSGTSAPCMADVWVVKDTP